MRCRPAPATAFNADSLDLEIRVLRTPLEKAVLLTQRDMADNICFFAHERIERRTFIVALAHTKIVGMAVLAEHSHRVPGALGLCFISTHLDYRKKGIASQLVPAVFAYAKAQGKAIANTAYEDLGAKYLQHVLERAALACLEVELIENGPRGGR